MRGIKFESFDKFIFECKTLIPMWVYLCNKYTVFVKKNKKRALLYIMVKSQGIPKPELYAVLDGWWNIIHMYESMYELWIYNQI